MNEEDFLLVKVGAQDVCVVVSSLCFKKNIIFQEVKDLAVWRHLRQCLPEPQVLRDSSLVGSLNLQFREV